MKNRFLMICVLSVISMAMTSCNVENSGDETQYDSSKKYFDVAVSDVAIVDEIASEEDEPDKRLSISISIQNNSIEEFFNAGYTLTLNDEAEPYIAGQVLKFSQPQGIHILPESKFDEYMDKEIQTIDDEPIALGFEAQWDMLLTTKENLREYHNLEPDGIYDAVQDITVDIFWDSGEQREVIPITISK